MATNTGNDQGNGLLQNKTMLSKIVIYVLVILFFMMFSIIFGQTFNPGIWVENAVNWIRDTFSQTFTRFSSFTKDRLDYTAEYLKLPFVDGFLFDTIDEFSIVIYSLVTYIITLRHVDRKSLGILLGGTTFFIILGPAIDFTLFNSDFGFNGDFNEMFAVLGAISGNLFRIGALLDMGSYHFLGFFYSLAFTFLIALVIRNYILEEAKDKKFVWPIAGVASIVYLILWTTIDFTTDIASIVVSLGLIATLIYTIYSIHIENHFTWERGNIELTLATALGFVIIQAIDIWELTIDTLVLIVAASVMSVVIGVPIGILSAKNDTLWQFVRPVLDFMQTLPAFLYLIPSIFFFRLGVVPGLISTFIFAVPPAIRLTNLGIRQVPTELDEVAEAYGTTPRQKLLKVELPVAFPNIMAGINQVIMLALSMVVIAALVGAGGLGRDVVRAITQLDLELGFNAGFGVVLIAIILDRITGSIIDDE